MGDYVELADGAMAALEVGAGAAVAGAAAAGAPTWWATHCVQPLVRAVRRLEEASPLAHRLLFQIAPGMLSVCLFYADLSTCALPSRTNDLSTSNSFPRVPFG